MTPTSTTSSRATRIDAHVGNIVDSIGAKIRHLRKSQRLSLQQLATVSDVSAAAIHKIEHNDMVPTVTTLLKIATALGRPASYFIEDERFATPVSFTSKDERGAVFTPHGGLDLASISGPYAPFKCAAAIATIRPGANSGTKPLVHPGEELIYVLQGEVIFDIDPHSYRVTAGDSLHFLGDQAHRWRNTSDTECVAVWFVLRDS